MLRIAGRRVEFNQFFERGPERSFRAWSLYFQSFLHLNENYERGLESFLKENYERGPELGLRAWSHLDFSRDNTNFYERGLY